MDRVSDMFARIKNGQIRRRVEIEVLASKYCGKILDCLTEEGYIRGYTDKGKIFIVYLKYKNGKPVIEECNRISTQGCRRYLSCNELKKSYYRNELIVFSSNKGIYLNSALVLKNLNIGGEGIIRIR
jgi:small subunit ribosomal protein S8